MKYECVECGFKYNQEKKKECPKCGRERDFTNSNGNRIVGINIVDEDGQVLGYTEHIKGINDSEYEL